MGLDSVELLLAIEETFHITISDAEAARVLTAGDLHALILAKMPTPASGAPTSEPSPSLGAAFFQLRPALMRVFSLRRSRVRPSTLLPSLMPTLHRRRTWQRLQQAAGLRLPELEHPLWAHMLLILASVAIACAPLFTGIAPAGVLALGIFLLVVALVAYRVLLRATPFLRVAFPMRPPTVGNLARQVLSLNYAVLALQRGVNREAEVCNTLCHVIARQMQIDAATIGHGDRLARDLGID